MIPTTRSKTAFTIQLLVNILLLSCTLVCAQVAPAGLSTNVSNLQEPIQVDLGRLLFPPPKESHYKPLKENEVHRYRGTFGANHYLQIRVDFRAVDGVVRLYSPSGKKLDEIDLPSSTQARKEIWLITEDAGEYELEVQARNPNSEGNYYASVHSLIANTDENRKLIEATRLHAEGWRLHEIGTQEALRKAIPILQSAVGLWRELGEDWLYQECSMLLGEVYHLLSEYRKAIQVYETLLPYTTDVVDTRRSDPTWTYNNLASSHNAVGEKQKALEYCGKSLVATQNADRFMRETRGLPITPVAFGIALNCLGNLSLQLGEKQRALDYFYEAAAYITSVDTRDIATFLLARSYRGLSQVHMSLGDYERAIRYSKQALQYSRTNSDYIGEVEALNILATSYFNEANYGEATARLKQALLLTPRTGDRQGHAKALTNLGYLYLNSTSLKDAEQAFTEARLIYHEIENRLGEARALTGIGAAVRKSGDTSRAIEFYSQSMRLRESLIDPEGVAETLFEFASAHLAQGELTTARSEIEKALEQIEFVRRGFSVADMRAAYRATVQPYYELYTRILMLLHARSPNKGYDDLAFEQSEVSRARSLLELLREAGLNIREGVDPELLQRERELEQLLSDKSEYRTRLLSRPFTPEQRAAADAEIEALIEKRRRVQADIRTVSPGYAQLTQPERHSLHQIQTQILDPKTVLLEYELGEEASFLWLVTSDSLSSFVLPKRSEVEKLARPVYMSLSTSSAAKKFPKHANRLAQVILQPVARQIKGKRLLIVSSGILQYLPFSVLPSPGSGFRKPLIVDHEIVNLPSASTLVSLRREQSLRRIPTKQLAVLADPVFSSDDSRVRRKDPMQSQAAKLAEDRSVPEIRFSQTRQALSTGVDGKVPRLHATRSEAQAISRTFAVGKQMIALDFEASRKTALTRELGEYEIVHFATHAFVDSQNPELSGLVFSLVDQDGLPVNGFLQAHEIYGLKLPVELVVLSACSTALGKNVKGEGLLGITRGFMYAGARRVVSSMWEVNSRATAELMTRFYRKMLNSKLSPAAALRAAQVSMWRDRRWNSPNLWAGFIIQGEFR